MQSIRMGFIEVVHDCKGLTKSSTLVHFFMLLSFVHTDFIKLKVAMGLLGQRYYLKTKSFCLIIEKAVL